MKNYLLFILFCAWTIQQANSQNTPAPKGKTAPPQYKNAQLPTQNRVVDLMQRMTLDEKIAQMQCHWEFLSQGGLFNTKGEIDETNLIKLAPLGLGQVARPSEGRGLPQGKAGIDAFKTATNCNLIQKYFVEKTRLGIPVMFHEEALHGNQAIDATNFPSHLALGATWNEALLTDVYTAISKEIRLRGGHQVLAPVVDLARDPRWGRTEECLGEDPYLVSRLAVAEIKAYQGGIKTEKIPSNHVVATLKHFGVHGASEGGVNVAPSFVDERSLRETYFVPFEACVKAGALSLMPCYNELSGIPAHSNKWMLSNILRNEWGFKGTIVSDYFALNDLQTLHKIAQNDEEAARWALVAGVDVETPSIASYKTLSAQVKAGKVTVAQIDAAVNRILTTKFNLGLFENPYTNPGEAQKIVGCDEHRKIALHAAQEAMVLLKNEDNLLPLQKGKYKKIAIVGPNADRCILGGYSDKPKQLITPLQALKAKVGSDFELIYTEGVRLTDAGDWFSENKDLKATSHEDNVPRMREAIEKCKEADLILYFGGSNEAIFREAWDPNNHYGDLPSIDLFGDQNELILELKKLNKPMAGFVFSGPVLACNTLNDNVSSLVQCFYLGQETGDAVADLILGNINPSGKLPMTIPRSVGHIPAYYSYKPSARRGFAFNDITPLYPFGHGLSFTSFSYKNLKTSVSKIRKTENIIVSVELTNTGNREGAETVQLYIRDVVSSVTRPVKELKDFKKIMLKAGETQSINFTITPEKLSFWNRDMKKVIESGLFEVQVGGSSAVTQSVNFEVVD